MMAIYTHKLLENLQKYAIASWQADKGTTSSDKKK
jgi:hypothetical protein